MHLFWTPANLLLNIRTKLLCTQNGKNIMHTKWCIARIMQNHDKLWNNLLYRAFFYYSCLTQHTSWSFQDQHLCRQPSTSTENCRKSILNDIVLKTPRCTTILQKNLLTMDQNSLRLVKVNSEKSCSCGIQLREAEGKVLQIQRRHLRVQALGRVKLDSFHLSRN